MCDIKGVFTLAFQELPYLMYLFITWKCVCFVLMISNAIDLEDTDVQMAVTGLAWALWIQNVQWI